MRVTSWLFIGVIAAIGVSTSAAAQAVQHLTLKEAEQQALQSHPAIRASEYSARAAGQTVREVRSAYFPTVFANFTGAQAQDGSRITAGGLNNPLIFDRFAVGFSVSQMVTDFGRTHDLVASASLKADAQEQQVTVRRADVLLQVDRAYFAALRAKAVQRVAEETVEARQLVVDQVTALAASNLKSSLDVSFANVSLAEAKLLLVQARNEVLSAYATLSATLGGTRSLAYDLQDEPLPPSPPADAGALVAEAMRERPDVASARFSRESASMLADAQRALSLPTVSVVGAAGTAPYHQLGLNNQYSAIGINVSVPVTNGNLYPALRAEATLRASAEDQSYRDLENQVTRDVQIAWLNAQTAFQRLDLTSQLLAQASDALELGQARYNLGLSSIVELTQAQLNKTQAEIEQASARYEYQSQSAALRFQTGTLK
ncbi:MAG: TolC family protein [Blastocatellia bacterium]|nr:MAG: TolC family protein [Blastocatellia bacterium]